MNRTLFIAIMVLLSCIAAPLFSQTAVYDVVPAATPLTATYNDGFNMGSMSASGGTWWGVGSLVAGCCVGGVMPVSLGWGVPLVSAAAGSIPIAVAAAGNPQPQPVMLMTLEQKGPDYINGFRAGYSQAQKKKNVSSAAIGMGISVALAVVAVLIIENAPEDDELKWAP